ncbi:MAG TPA: DNA recombination protein RmuC [Prolixibacteraceae bacterium]|nr:DNA recombination protein RmuC [Prolixibacteraceae bacterium]
MEWIVYLLAGLALGFSVTFFVFRIKLLREGQRIDRAVAEATAALEYRNHELEKELIVSEDRLQIKTGALAATESELREAREKNELLGQQIARAEAEYRSLEEKLSTQKAEMEELQKRFTIEFENIAHKILKQNTEEFTASNQKNISEILAPLKEKIVNFEKKVEETYEKGLKDQTDLRAELKKLYELNARISEEANNLTRALKADSKKMGNWGEVILERILERSGLTLGQEYEKQFSTENAEGRKIQPDIIVNLPDRKHIIIDSKVSLVAYEQLVNADNDEERARLVKAHIASVRAHIKGLSEKHYFSAKDLNTPDFVLLFVPIEASFSVAVQEDKELFSYAWDNKVVIVSPSTLLATLRTIASIWKQENQARNALEIARQGGALYDKFSGFVDDMLRIGNNLDTTRKSYDAAMNKLSTGRGNLLNATQRLKELGAKTTKEIPQHLLEE